MNFIDALAWMLLAAVVLASIAMFAAAFKGSAKHWFFGLFAMMIALGGIASLQYQGRAQFVFNFLALATVLSSCLMSGVVAVLGFYRRQKAKSEG